MARPATDIRLRLVHAARAQFLRFGVDGASLREIAAKARTSLGMIHYYFPTKDDLFFAVVEEIYQQLLVDLEAALVPGPPVVERLRSLFRRLASLSGEELDVVRLVVREALVSSARRDRLIERFLRGHVPLVLGVLDEGVRTGVLAAGRPLPLLLMATFALAGPPQVVARQVGARVGGRGFPSGEKLADALLEVLLHGIGASTTSPSGARTRTRTGDPGSGSGRRVRARVRVRAPDGAE
jgi:AcrR family transcriptional regulator